MRYPKAIKIFLLATCLTACNRQEVRYYEIPKVARMPVATQNAALPAGHPVVGPPPPVIAWQAPEAWVDNGPDRVRRGSFHIHGTDNQSAEVVIIDVPAEEGNEARMVKLLGRELKLVVGDGASFTPATTEKTLGEHDFHTYSMVSEEPELEGGARKAAPAAFLLAKERLWYFRMTGAESIVDANREGFEALLASVELLAPPTGSMATRSLPPGAVAQGSNPQWTTPENWAPGRPSQMRKGSFAVIGEGGLALDISITAFPGDVGGIASNVNRWRGQLGLSPVDPQTAEGLITRMPINGKECLLVDLVSEQPIAGRTVPVRMIVGTIMHEGASWFFKMAGDAPLADEERDGFIAFLQSVTF